MNSAVTLCSRFPVRALLSACLVPLLLALSACGGGSEGGGLSLIPPANASPTESNGSFTGGNDAPAGMPASPSENVASSPSSGNKSNDTGNDSTPAPVTPPTSLPVAPAPFSCAAGAITCVEVASTSLQAQASVPVTFGQPFKAGDWKHKETGLVARDNFNSAVPLQFDEISSHRDGSARFAVLSAQVSGLQAGERRIINLFKGTNSATTSVLPADPVWNLELEAKVYSRQTTLVIFGNRNGTTAGIPFVAGETITLKVNGPSSESYSLTVNASQAGGGHETLTKIAEAFMEIINRQSSVYQADKFSTGGGYERLWIGTRNPNGGAFSIQFIYGGQAKISQENLSSYQVPQVWTVQAQPLLKQAIAASNAGQADSKRRLHGVAATEFSLSAPFRNASTGVEHPHLVARLDARLYESGTRVRTDVVLENNWTHKPDPRNITYELTVKHGGQVVHQQPVFTHFHHARWHKVVWKGPEPGVQLRHHMPYFMASRAVWNYNLNLKIAPAALANEATQLANRRQAQAHLGPMGNVMLETAFAATGGRPEIGPYPRWTALYLLSQDERARASMMANADAAAAVPVHYRDDTTGQPIDTISNPNLSVYGTPTVPKSEDPTIWAADTAHQGSFAYVPYLITGDRFYLDEAMFWASWNVFSMPSAYRSNAASLISRQQIRGQAWALRSIGEVHRMLPDSHSMKPFYQTILSNNLKWYKETYVDKQLGSTLGMVHLNSDSAQHPPWMGDFLMIVLAQLAENAEPDAAAILSWFSNFYVDRFQREAEGFCTARAPGYHWYTTDTDGAPIRSWSTLFARNYPGDAGKPCTSLSITEGYPTGAAGYAAYARGMLGATANAGISRAHGIHSKWKSMTPQMDSAFTSDPTWAIVPSN